MEESEVLFGQLYGTITKPKQNKDKNPAVLIIPGSGPIDRNGNNDEHEDLNLYNQLAKELTGLGYVTLRYDKRGTGKSEGDYLKIGLWDLVEDAQGALEYLKNQSFVDPDSVFVIGHSEGAMLGPTIIKDERIAGLVLLSGGTETLKEATAFQRERVIESLKKTKGLKGLLIKLFGTARRIKKQARSFDARIMNSEEDVIRVEGKEINAKWFREHYDFDVTERLKKVACPVLAVIGEYDLQSNPGRLDDVATIVQTEKEMKLIPKMNHMLREQPEECTILELQHVYKGIGEKPLSPELINTLEQWLEKHTK